MSKVYTNVSSNNTVPGKFQYLGYIPMSQVNINVSVKIPMSQVNINISGKY